MKKVELLAPAGNLEKLKVALTYGADAVFIGGKEFSLRSKASNFSLEEIKEGCEFAHRLGKKIHVTCNIVMHNNDVNHLEEYLINLEKAGVDAIITSSLFMVKLCKKLTNMEVHISTQQSIMNQEAINFWMSQGADRVVLGRECSIENMKTFRKNTPIEIEAFIHGGMCSSYSGKCMLSNLMVNRDANRGGCAYSCRWMYDLYEKDELITKRKEDYFKMASKDLCALKFIPDLIEAGVDSFKIEGRRKASNYIACVVKAYRRIIDNYYLKQELEYSKSINDISKCENRLTSYGFLKGNVSVEQMSYTIEETLLKAGEYIALVKECKDGYVYLDLHNKIENNTKYLVLSPIEDDYEIVVNELESKENRQIDYIRKEIETVAGKDVRFKCDKEIPNYSIIRLIK